MVDLESLKRTKGHRLASRRELAAFAAGLTSVLFSPLAPASLAGKKSKNRKNKSKKKGTHGKKKNKQKEPAGGKGQSIVNYAQRFKGSPYVWGGESPRGFDCSGFTWYVYNHAAGKDIGRTEDEQYKLGQSIGRGAWQPGDLVFFKNTFERGISHVGIFMNGDNFIHAENESTGVVVSSLNSDYYRAHYAGARRIV